MFPASRSTSTSGRGFCSREWRSSVRRAILPTMSYQTAIIGVVNTALAALIAFGVSLSEAQTTTVVALVNAVLVLAGMLWQSRKKGSSAANP